MTTVARKDARLASRHKATALDVFGCKTTTKIGNHQLLKHFSCSEKNSNHSVPTRGLNGYLIIHLFNLRYCAYSKTKLLNCIFSYAAIAIFYDVQSLCMRIQSLAVHRIARKFCDICG